MMVHPPRKRKRSNVQLPTKRARRRLFSSSTKLSGKRTSGRMSNRRRAARSRSSKSRKSRRTGKAGSKLAAARKAMFKVATLPKMPSTKWVRHTMYATYKFTITPKDRAAYMSTASIASSIPNTCQGALGFTVNVNTPHHPFDLFAGTVNFPYPNDATDGYIINHQQPRGCRLLANMLSASGAGLFSLGMVTACDYTVKLERPVDELYEMQTHGYHRNLATGITDDGTQVRAGDRYFAHNGNTNKYLCASWISDSQANFLDMDSDVNTGFSGENRIDKDSYQQFVANLYLNKGYQAEHGFLDVPTSGSVIKKFSKNWRMSDYPIYAPHPVDRDPFAQHLWRASASTTTLPFSQGRADMFQNYAYNFSTSNTDITNISTAAPITAIRAPVFIQPFTAVPVELLESHFDDGDGNFIDRTDAAFDLPYVHVTLKMKYTMYLRSGIENVNIGSPGTLLARDEQQFNPTNGINP